MKRIWLFFSMFFVVFGINNVFAQQISIGFGYGMSNAQMTGLKSVNRTTLANLPFKAKQVENFPSAQEYNFEFNASIFKKYSLGVCYNYFSTGSRISSIDYSGEYRFDNISTNTSYGFINKFSIFEAKAFLIQFTAAFGWYKSKFKLTEVLNLYQTQSNQYENKFESKGMFIKPGIDILYSFKFIKIGLYGSYYSNTENEISLSRNNSLKLVVPNTNHKVKTDWKGFQYGIKFLISSFNSKNK